MSSGSCEQTELVSLYVLGSLPPDEVAALERHIASCQQCSRELDALQPVVDTLAAWPTDVLRPARSLWGQIVQRIGGESVGEPSAPRRLEDDWEEMGPGILCKVLAFDAANARVSMLVRLAAGHGYPGHRHAGVEEVYVLQGELRIDGKKLAPGEYQRAERGTIDWRVWSETGCTCIILTSLGDSLI
jgi:hypothetical protein